MSLLDFFFLKRCVQCKKVGGYLCPQCFSYIQFIDHMVCAVCQRQAMGGITHPLCKTTYGIDGMFSSLVYKGIVKKLVYTFKYPPYLTNMQSLLVDLLYEGIIQKEQFYLLLQKRSYFVPIPLYRTKFRKRGYNQSLLLAQGLGQKFSIEIIDCLDRQKNTKTQVGLSKEERLINIKEAFSLKQSFRGRVKDIEQIFLIDDVATSGATMREAAKVLKKAGVKYVWGVTLAHGE